MKKFDIWTGYYTCDGYFAKEPELVDSIKALDFKSACLKHEILQQLHSIELQEKQGYVNKQTYVNFYNPENLYNSWTGKYYETKEEAQKSFINR